MPKKVISLFLCLLCVFLLCGCGAQKAQKEKLTIVTSSFVAFDFARAVAGEKAEIELLIKAGTEVHSFDPKPSDIVAINNCDLFVFIGGESEAWAKRILKSSDKKVNTLCLFDCADLLKEDGEDEYDEHIWTSTLNAQKMVNAVCTALCKTDKANKEYYKRNAENYNNKIKTVTEKIEKVVNNSDEKFIVVADRFPFKYMANQFGIKYEAAFSGCAISADISLKTMNKMVSAVSENGVKTAFYIELSNKCIANALSEETGVELLELGSAQNVTKQDFEKGITYIDIMNKNAEALKRGIK